MRSGKSHALRLKIQQKQAIQAKARMNGKNHPEIRNQPGNKKSHPEIKPEKLNMKEYLDFFQTFVFANKKWQYVELERLEEKYSSLWGLMVDFAITSSDEEWNRFSSKSNGGEWEVSFSSTQRWQIIAAKMQEFYLDCPVLANIRQHPYEAKDQAKKTWAERFENSARAYFYESLKNYLNPVYSGPISRETVVSILRQNADLLKVVYLETEGHYPIVDGRVSSAGQTLFSLAILKGDKVLCHSLLKVMKEKCDEQTIRNILSQDPNLLLNACGIDDVELFKQLRVYLAQDLAEQDKVNMFKLAFEKKCIALFEYLKSDFGTKIIDQALNSGGNRHHPLELLLDPKGILFKANTGSLTWLVDYSLEQLTNQVESAIAYLSAPEVDLANRADNFVNNLPKDFQLIKDTVISESFVGNFAYLQGLIHEKMADEKAENYYKIARQHGNFRADIAFLRDGIRQISVLDAQLKKGDFEDPVEEEKKLEATMSHILNAIYERQQLAMEEGAKRKQLSGEYILVLEEYIFSLDLACVICKESQDVEDRKRAINLIANLIKVMPFQGEQKSEFNSALGCCEQYLKRDSLSQEARGVLSQALEFLQLREKQDQVVIDLQHALQTGAMEIICKTMETFPFDIQLKEEKLETSDAIRVAIMRCRAYLAHLSANPLDDVSSFNLSVVLEEANRTLTRALLKDMYLKYQASTSVLFQAEKKENTVRSILFLLEVDTIEDAIVRCEKESQTCPDEKMYQKMMNLLKKVKPVEEELQISKVTQRLFNQPKVLEGPAMDQGAVDHVLIFTTGLVNAGHKV